MARKLVRQTTKQTIKPQTNDYLSKIESSLESNQSRLSMILGGLILLVIGILVFNYFNKSKSDLGPAQQTEQQETTEDVSPSQLPGKYTVKEGDTLFIIAEKYYQDGDKYLEIAKANDLSDVNTIEVGQVLQIPKLEESLAAAPTESPTPSETPTEPPAIAPTDTPSPTVTPIPEATTPQTPEADMWGPKIAGNTYTVSEGDWLSTIAGRAYGDIFAYQKIAQANNIPNPDYITPGMVLVIPR